MVEHVSMQFVSKKSCPVKVFVYYKTWHMNKETWKHFKMKMEMRLNGDDSHAIGNALRRHVRKWCNMFS
jgi:hypothetical protein